MSDIIETLQESTSIKALTKDTTQLAETYANYAVHTTEEYVNGAEHLKDIKGQLGRIEEERKNLTRPLDESKKRIMSFFRQFTDRMETAERQVKAGLLSYKSEQDRRAREQQRLERERAAKREKKLREEAEAKEKEAAEKERVRLAKLREEADERARIEAARLKEERDAAKDDAEKQRVAEKEAAAEIRQQDEAHQIHQQALAAEETAREASARSEILEDRADSAVAAPVVSDAPKIKGISTRKIWRYEIIDVAQIPDLYKTVDEKKIGRYVKAMREDAVIPGVRVYSDEVMAAGRSND